VADDQDWIRVELKRGRTTGLPMKQAWKARLYETYAMSGHSSDYPVKPASYFASRRCYIQTVIRRHVDPSRAIRILDLGCGHGAFLYFLKQAGYQDIQGVDRSPQQVNLAKRLGITGIQQSEIAGYIASVEAGTVDVVLLMDILEHLTRQELFDTLDEVFRILRPGGKCIGHVPNASGLYGMYVRYGDLSHELAFTPQSIHQLFSMIGFYRIQCFEERPMVHGVLSIFRWLLWTLGSFPLKLMLAAETGGTSFILSQNVLFTAEKSHHIAELPKYH
jgi:SAM-dependent methyltransferase